MLDVSWMKKLIIGGKITIGYVDFGFSCKVSSEPKFEQELKPESQQITYPFTEFPKILDDIRKLLSS